MIPICCLNFSSKSSSAPFTAARIFSTDCSRSVLHFAPHILLMPLCCMNFSSIIQRTFYCYRNTFNRLLQISPEFCTTYLADAIMLHELLLYIIQHTFYCCRNISYLLVISTILLMPLCCMNFLSVSSNAPFTAVGIFLTDWSSSPGCNFFKISLAWFNWDWKRGKILISMNVQGFNTIF